MKASATPDISFVVPVSGCEDLLPAAIASAIGSAPYSAEVIVVDDGPDYLPEPLVQNLRKIFPELRYMQQAHAGAGAARNRGLAQARGEFVCFLDADDLVVASCFHELLRLARKHTSDITSGTIESFRGRRRWTADVWRCLTTLEAINTSCVHHPVSVRHNSACGKLYRREFLESQCLLFPTDVQRGEDWQFSLSAMARSSRLTFMPKTSYRYRLHGKERPSMSSKVSGEAFRDLSLVHRRLTELFAATETPRMRQYRDTHFLSSIRYHLARLLKSNTPTELTRAALSDVRAFLQTLAPSALLDLNPYDRLGMELIRVGAFDSGTALLVRRAMPPLTQLKTMAEVLHDNRAMSEIIRFQWRWGWSVPFMSLLSRFSGRL